MAADVPDVGQFFERPMEGETHKAFMAFLAYRDMRWPRSLRGAAEVFYSDGSQGYQEATGGLPESGTDAQLTRFKRWSGEFSWVARVEAFDLEVTRRRALESEQRRRELEDDTWRAAQIGLHASVQRIHAWRLDPLDIPASQVVPLLRESVAMARLALGEPSERIETTGGDAPRREPDFSQLSDVELDQFEDLCKKVFDAPASADARPEARGPGMIPRRKRPPEPEPVAEIPPPEGDPNR